jgi:hypothetical protein
MILTQQLGEAIEHATGPPRCTTQPSLRTSTSAPSASSARWPELCSTGVDLHAARWGSRGRLRVVQPRQQTVGIFEADVQRAQTRRHAADERLARGIEVEAHHAV